MAFGFSERFNAIYQSRLWGPGSGPGSVGAPALQFANLVRRVLDVVRPGRVVELGCGDWQVSKLVDWSGTEYLGFDVVDSLVSLNRRTYSSPKVRFQLGVENAKDVPAFDLLVVKDVLQHWSDSDIHRFAALIRDAPAVLVTNTTMSSGPYELNAPIVTGRFRPLDVSRPPFNWPLVPIGSTSFVQDGGEVDIKTHLSDQRTASLLGEGRAE